MQLFDLHLGQQLNSLPKTLKLLLRTSFPWDFPSSTGEMGSDPLDLTCFIKVIDIGNPSPSTGRSSNVDFDEFRSMKVDWTSPVKCLLPQLDSVQDHARSGDNSFSYKPIIQSSLTLPLLRYILPPFFLGFQGTNPWTKDRHAIPFRTKEG